MITIAVNQDAKAKKIISEFNKCIFKIRRNAASGNATTELEIPKEIASDVREMLQKEVHGIHFMIVRSGINQYTGKVDNFTSRTDSDTRYYKVRIG